MAQTNKEIIYPKESYNIIGACYEVYNALGCGFLEAVYQESLAIEFKLRKIPFVEQQEMKLNYKGVPLKQGFKPDFICYDKIILEIKAVPNLIDEFRAQIINYLSASHFQLGLLVNFGHYPGLEYERFVFIPD
ncbi:MAG: GxxExxY protein [Calditrichaeota bacterium]|nr:GxxExxY protein [Calditrichota bacterium]